MDHAGRDLRHIRTSLSTFLHMLGDARGFLSSKRVGRARESKSSIALQVRWTPLLLVPGGVWCLDVHVTSPPLSLSSCSSL